MHAIDEVFLFRVAREINEGQHRHSLDTPPASTRPQGPPAYANRDRRRRYHCANHCFDVATWRLRYSIRGTCRPHARILQLASAPQCFGKLSSSRVAIVGLLRQRFDDHRIQPGRNVPTNRSNRRDRIDGMARHRGLRIFGGIGQISCQHLEQHAPQAIDIGARIDFLSTRLFRTHVVGGPYEAANQRDVVATCVAHGLPDAEIGYHGVPLYEQDVPGLYVAVDDVLLVRV